MAKFLNKKEQVYDFKLTSYGKYLLSIGTFRPTYYAFYDDNIVYDSAYINISESQNETITRINEKTQYLEGLLLFEDVEKAVSNNKGEKVNFYDLDITPTKEVPRKDTFKYDKAIGDSFLDGAAPNHAPAWKVVALNGKIIDSAPKDNMNNLQIPQVNIKVDYTKKISNADAYVRGFTPAGESFEVDPMTGQFVNSSTQVSVGPSEMDPSTLSSRFYDENVIHLMSENLMVYVEEANTEMLTENFDVEVFEQQIEEGHPATGSVRFLSTPAIGNTLTINDGSQTRVFEFGFKPGDIAVGNVFVQIDEGSLRMQSKGFAQAIDTTFGRGAGALGTIYPHFSGSTATVHLTNTNKWYLYGDPQILNKTITTNAGAGKFELFGLAGAKGRKEVLRRKYFYKDTPQIIDGIMVNEQYQSHAFPENLVSSSVEYYFDLNADKDVDQAIACRSIQMMNKESYYVDFDFDCGQKTINPSYYDIYGSEVEPEICLD
jgi:hypothetical protein